MSLVGTRPILQDELRQYELHHRARIAIKPGITGMWQVSGRSDITDFEEVVRLDTEYISKPEGEFCPELTAARTRVWEVLRPYRMKLLRLAPAKFIHFGTTREILELMNGGVDEYHYLGWNRKVGSSIRSDVSGYNSVLSSRASVGKDCY